jgi:hypothetical protein
MLLNCVRCGSAGANIPDPTGAAGVFCAACARLLVGELRELVEITLSADHGVVLSAVAWVRVATIAAEMDQARRDGNDRASAWAIEQLYAQIALARELPLDRPPSETVTVRAPRSIMAGTVWAAYKQSVESIHAASASPDRTDLDAIRSALQAADSLLGWAIQLLSARTEQPHDERQVYDPGGP